MAIFVILCVVMDAAFFKILTTTYVEYTRCLELTEVSEGIRDEYIRLGSVFGYCL